VTQDTWAKRGRRMTTEQAEAFAQLRTLAAASRLRVRPDAEGWPVIPGRLGQIEYHDGRNLAVFTDRPRLHAKLWAIPGVRRHQTGDQEMRALLPPEALESVAGVIRTRRRRTLSPERARRLGVQTAYRATSRSLDRVGASSPASEVGSGAAPETGPWWTPRSAPDAPALTLPRPRVRMAPRRRCAW